MIIDTDGKPLICGHTGKRCYGKREVGDVIKCAKNKKHHRRSRIPKRSYFCKTCGFWHLTSSSDTMNEKNRHRQMKKIYRSGL